MTDTTITIRVDGTTLERLDRLAEAMSKAAHGADVKRGTAARAVLEQGIEAMERQLKIGKPKR
ncbi:MAG TPA: hypothetical protein VHC69_31660 [Polyangiaceae bacterium]|nr:hypothetical protein [Polyangiaceae bacterium]